MSVGMELAAGGIAGAAGILSTQPMDTIRIRLQSSTGSLGISRGYSGVIDCFMLTWRREGIRGLYKGVASPTVTVGFMNAALFFSYELASDVVRRRSKRPVGEDMTLSEVVFAGSTAGLASAFITGPSELVKCIAQTNLTNKGTVAEEWAIFRNMIRNHGCFGAHGPCRGLWMTIVRDTPSFGLYFGLYEAMTRSLGKNKLSSFVSGGCAGAFAWTVIYPLDLIKTRWSIARVGEYSSVWHCFRTNVAQEGYPMLLKGYGATMARAWPQNAVIFVTYEMVKGLLMPPSGT